MLDTWRAKLAVGIAVALFLLAFYSLFSILRERLRVGRWRAPEAQPSSVRRLLVWGRRLTVSLALLILLSVPYALFVEPNWLSIERVRISSVKIPPGKAPIRILLLSDTHSEHDVRLEQKIPVVARELKPDLILFAGDSVNDPQALALFRRMMEELATIAPTYAVRGNWDVWFFGDLDLFGGTGVVELTAERREQRLLKDGIEIRLAGFAVQTGEAGRLLEANEPLVADLLQGMPASSFRVFVHHFPELAELAVHHGADLVLAGDTHGGQVRLPVLNELIRLSRFGVFWEAGLHRLGRSYLYVSRGIGMEGGGVPRVRFLCRPEITLLEVGPE